MGNGLRHGSDGDVLVGKKGGGVAGEEEAAGQRGRSHQQLARFYAAPGCTSLLLLGPGVSLRHFTLNINTNLGFDG